MGAFDKAWAFLKSDADDFTRVYRDEIAREEDFDRYLDEKERQAYKDGEMTDEERQEFLQENAKWHSPPKSVLLDNPPIGGSADAHDAWLHDLIEQDILSEIEKEGGALGMKNLSGIADEQNLNEVLSQMEAAGKIFRHEDGDIYTHEPEG